MLPTLTAPSTSACGAGRPDRSGTAPRGAAHRRSPAARPLGQRDRCAAAAAIGPWTPSILRHRPLPRRPARRRPDPQRPKHVLPWGDQPGRPTCNPTGFAPCKAVVTLLGPDGPIPSPDLRLRPVLPAPRHAITRLHAHEAAETYTILAGSALWTRRRRPALRRSGGRCHPPPLPNLPHAMRAGPDGLPRHVALVRRHRASTPTGCCPIPEANPG